jgi:putative ABC transport system substrate-binding protein
MSSRREFISLLGGAAAAWPLVAHAQQPDRMRRIGVLLATGQKDPDMPNRIAAMRQALQSFGWNEGRNLWIDIRFGEGDTKLIQKQCQARASITTKVIGPYLRIFHKICGGGIGWLASAKFGPPPLPP